ncbi:hypothetical protein ACJZ2D_000805 [Fusarium nematophilum]
MNARRCNNDLFRLVRLNTRVDIRAYNWLSMNMFYMPLKPVEFPSMLPVPGENMPWKDGKNLNVQWPPHVPPWYAGKTFTAVCSFWPIMQEVRAVYFVQRLSFAASTARPPLAFAESKFQKLLRLCRLLESRRVARRIQRRPHCGLPHPLPLSSHRHPAPLRRRHIAPAPPLILLSSQLRPRRLPRINQPAPAPHANLPPPEPPPHPLPRRHKHGTRPRQQRHTRRCKGQPGQQRPQPGLTLLLLPLPD